MLPLRDIRKAITMVGTMAMLPGKNTVTEKVIALAMMKGASDELALLLDDYLG